MKFGIILNSGRSRILGTAPGFTRMRRPVFFSYDHPRILQYSPASRTDSCARRALGYDTTYVVATDGVKIDAD